MDTAYSAFRFKDGIRRKENIIGGTNLIILDVDNAGITDKEAFLLVEDLRCIVVRTSDPTNEYKFRVIIETTPTIDIEDQYWNYFIESVSDELGFKVDILPKAQIYFSYKDSADSMQCNVNGRVLDVQNHLINAINKKLVKRNKTTRLQELLDNPMDHFSFAYNAPNGEGSRALFKVSRWLFDAGAEYEQIEKIIYEINEYWINPMEEKRLVLTILNPLRRLYEA
jgi:hypothetical protein